MRRNVAAEWPECETTEALEQRDRARALIRDIAGGIVSVAVVLATWQALVMYVTATMSAA